MNATKQHTPQRGPLYLEAEQLANQIERDLLDPTANRESFFQNIEHFADVLTKLRTDAISGVQHYMA